MAHRFSPLVWNDEAFRRSGGLVRFAVVTRGNLRFKPAGQTPQAARASGPINSTYLVEFCCQADIGAWKSGVGGLG